MSTAVLISGQMRTFAQCVANQNWMVYRHLDDPTFFISCADDEQAKDAYILEGYFPGKVHIEIVKQPDFPDAPSFELCRHSPYTPTPNNPSVVRSIMRQLWHYKRVWAFACEIDSMLCNHCAQFVRMRPDLWFHGDPYFNYADRGIGFRTLFVGPWKATCGGVNDRFSFMGAAAAYAYFNAVDKLPDLLKDGCPLHPETIQKAALERAGCTISNTLLAEFTCVRLHGKGDHVPLVEYPGELAALMTALAR